VTGTLPEGVTFNPATGVFSGTPGSSAQGTYPLTITASNGILPNATQSFSLVVTATPPFTNDPIAFFYVGKGTLVTFSTMVQQGVTVALAGKLPLGVTFIFVPATTTRLGGAALNANPAPGTGGIYPTTLEVLVNGVVQYSIPYIIEVYEGPTAITSANSLTITAGSSAAFQVTTKAGFPTPTFSVSGALPAGVSFNTTGAFSGTAESDSTGKYPVTITATGDPQFPAVAQGFTLNVVSLPVITSLNNTTFTEGVNNTFPVTATGYPTPGLNATITGIPWLTMTPHGLTGKPPLTALGTWTVTINASNQYGAATQSLTLFVKANPTITWNTPAAIQFGSPLSADQLNATAAITGIGSIPGTFTYSPVLGTVLPSGNNLVSVTFTPTDNTKYFEATQEVFITVNSAPTQPVQLITTQVLSRDTSNNLVAAITVANAGSSAAQNVVLTSVQIGTVAAGTITPASVASIGSGNTATFTATFPAASVPNSGTATAISLAGAYTGGTISSAAGVVLP
jgi:hypothetical protein